MLTKRIPAIIAAAVIFCGIAGAEKAPPEFQVAFIDSQKAIALSIEGKKALSLLEGKKSQINTRLGEIDKEILSLDSKYKNQERILSFEKKEALAFQIQELKTKRQRIEEDLVKEYRRMEFNLVNRLRADVFPIIEKIAKERNYAVVFDLSAGNVMYSHPDFDITAEVVKRYDTQKSQGTQ